MGGARFTESADGPGIERDGESNTQFAIQPGGGVDIPLNDVLAVRVMFDYRRVFVEFRNLDEIRVVGSEGAKKGIAELNQMTAELAPKAEALRAAREFDAAAEE